MQQETHLKNQKSDQNVNEDLDEEIVGDHQCLIDPATHQKLTYRKLQSLYNSNSLPALQLEELQKRGYLS